MSTSNSVKHGIWATCVVSVVVGAAWLRADPEDPDRTASREQGTGCPADMVRVHEFCIDRWEASMVDRRSGRPLSPFYPPQPRLLRRVLELWQRERTTLGPAAARAMPLPPPTWQAASEFQPMAVSRPGVVPQAYMSYFTARTACANAGKRLCTEKEWITACRGSSGTAFPYGLTYVPGRCNVYRPYHPGFLLHGSSSTGHTDPRLNLVIEQGTDFLLRPTGATPSCASQWNQDVIYDMVGNLDEWIDDEAGVFLGGFYARSTRQGCEAKIASHAPSYYDYSLGVRCCRDSGSSVRLSLHALPHDVGQTTK